MANLLGLGVASALTPTDPLLTVQGGLDVKTTVQDISDAVLGDLPTATDSVEGIVELATNVETVTGTATDIATTPAGVAASVSDAISNIPAQSSATETVEGIVELATTAEAVTGTDTTRAVTPAGLAAAIPAVSTPIINWTTATLVGTPAALGTIAQPEITSLNGTDIVLFDATVFVTSLQTYRFSSAVGVWSAIGSPLTITGSASPAGNICRLTGSTAAFFDKTNHTLRTYSFDGSNWTTVGNELALASVGVGSGEATTISSTHIVVRRGKFFETYEFDGTDWTLLGSTFDSGGGLGLNGGMSTLSGTDVLLTSTTDSALRQFRFNFSGNTWSAIGTDTVLSDLPIQSTALNPTDILVAFQNDTIATYRLDEGLGTWSKVGTGSQGLPVGSGAESMTAMNGTDIAFVDDNTEELMLLRNGFYVGPPPFHTTL